MRKMLLNLALVTMVVAGCAKNEILQTGEGGSVARDPNVISFQSTLGKTRSDYVLRNLQQATNGFNVVGLKADGSKLFSNDPADATPGDGAIAYKYDQAQNTWSWATATDKTWPAAGAYPLTFFAAYPSYKDNAHVVKSDKTERFIEVPAEIADQEDWLAALTMVNSKPSGGNAALAFKHIMSSIQFKVLTSPGNKVWIQSLKIVNVASKRYYSFKLGKWGNENSGEGAEPRPYTNFKDYVYWPEGASSQLTGIKEITGGVDNQPVEFNTDKQTLKLIPQSTTAAWNASGFKTLGVAAWTKWIAETTSPAPDGATQINAWHNTDYVNTAGNGVPSGMKPDGTQVMAQGFWKGARIELVFRVEDANGNEVIGRKSPERFIRVGYALNLAQLTNKDGSKGWIPGHKYTYTLSIATPDATNGTLLDPDYKDTTGGNTTDPVDNPSVAPGDDVTTGGTINFNVTVDDWVDEAQDIL